ncbi:MAG: hypothetical protein J5659_02145 [Clostridia bacterium]|nr:hypothetical protein [Clostridia bacterium]
MKRLFAVFSIIMLMFVSGCKNGINEFFKDIDGYIKKNTISAEQESVLDEGEEVVKIKPRNEKPEYPQLSAYNKLTDNQKKLYSIIRTAVENMELRLIDVTEYSNDNISSDTVVAHKAVMCDRPDLFWMPKTLSLVSVEDTKHNYLCFREYDGEKPDSGFFGITAEQKNQMMSQIKSVENEIINEIKNLPDAFEKELFIHDYLCKHIVYDKESADNLQNANKESMTIYGALVKGSAICEGYSKAMQYLCIKSGIPCSVVYGKYDDIAHMWNIVNPGDGLYYVDATFDDGSDHSVLHSFFNLTKAEISEGHIFSDGFSSDKTYDISDEFNFFIYDCKNTALNYFIKKGAYIRDDYKSAVDYALSEYYKGKKSAELKNITSLTNAQAFEALRQRLADKIDLKKSYEYEGKNIIVIVW